VCQCVGVCVSVFVSGCECVVVFVSGWVGGSVNIDYQYMLCLLTE
jgi:hypothetical protein